MSVQDAMRPDPTRLLLISLNIYTGIELQFLVTDIEKVSVDDIHEIYGTKDITIYTYSTVHPEMQQAPVLSRPNERQLLAFSSTKRNMETPNRKQSEGIVNENKRVKVSVQKAYHDGKGKACPSVQIEMSGSGELTERKGIR